jgi:predicted RNA-binding protein with PUA domain
MENLNDKLSNEAQNQPSCLGAVSGSFLFDNDLLEKVVKPEYVVGVDTYDKNNLAYCFGRKVDGVFEIMLSKIMRDENEFKQEVENLAKYFNADVFRSGE